MIIIIPITWKEPQRQLDSDANIFCRQRSSSLRLQPDAGGFPILLSFKTSKRPEGETFWVKQSIFQGQRRVLAKWDVSQQNLKSNEVTIFKQGPKCVNWCQICSGITNKKFDVSTLTLARDPILLPTRNSTFSSWIWKGRINLDD